MSEEKLIQEIYDLTLQNNTARELDEAFKQGIEETITHLKELNLLRLHDVSKSFYCADVLGKCNKQCEDCKEIEKD